QVGGCDRACPRRCTCRCDGRQTEVTAAIELRGVTTTFDGPRALEGLTADIRPGRLTGPAGPDGGATTAPMGLTAAPLEPSGLTGLVGPDGAGKTTLMRIMAALMAPSGGAVRVADHDVVTESERVHSIIGYMPQRFGLYEDLSVWENLRLYADLRGVDRGSSE